MLWDEVVGDRETHPRGGRQAFEQGDVQLVLRCHHVFWGCRRPHRQVQRGFPVFWVADDVNHYPPRPRYQVPGQRRHNLRVDPKSSRGCENACSHGPRDARGPEEVGHGRLGAGRALSSSAARSPRIQMAKLRALRESEASVLKRATQSRPQWLLGQIVRYRDVLTAESGTFCGSSSRERVQDYGGSQRVDP